MKYDESILTRHLEVMHCTQKVCALECASEGIKFLDSQAMGTSHVSVNDIKRGASEGIDFADSQARGVVLVGIPYPNVKDTKVGVVGREIVHKGWWESTRNCTACIISTQGGRNKVLRPYVFFFKCTGLIVGQSAAALCLFLKCTGLNSCQSAAAFVLFLKCTRLNTSQCAAALCFASEAHRV